MGKGQAVPVTFGAGTQAMDSAKPVGPDTLWRLYSMNKPVTAMAAMLLIEDGRMGLDQPIADVLPASAKMMVQDTTDASIHQGNQATKTIHVRQLLTHTAELGYTIPTTGLLIQP